MRNLIIIVFLLSNLNFCMVHPLWKPYFFPEQDENSKLLKILTAAYLFNLPKIYTISKLNGVEGEVLTLLGSNFSENSTENMIYFSGNVQAEILSSTQNTMVIKVPFGAKSGRIRIANANGISDSFDEFIVFRYFLTFSAGSNTETYGLNLLTGNISAVSGSPYALNIPLGAKFSIDGKFAFSGGFGQTTIQSYSVNQQTGVLSMLNASAGTTTVDPVFFVFHPNGRFLYVSSFSGASIAAFELNTFTGNLSKIGDYSQSCTCSLNHLDITPDGKFLYVNGNGGSEPIMGYSVNQINGSLANIAGSPFNTGVPNMEALLIDSTSTYLYSVVQSSVIIARRINTLDGSLTSLSGSPFTGTTNNFRAVMHPSGKFLYTVNILGATLGKHNINTSDGSLSLPSNLVFGENLQFVTLDPTGKFGFVSNTSSTNFYMFQVDETTGTPTLLNGGVGYATSGANNTVPVAYRIEQR
ncbi:IPT/TIG domain protein [Leptospira levettii]|uniref:Beta-propeller fold lactonase family protein n=1 Tax=Leptospira levettii TaxID=2023178 RepID=A0A5F2D7V1_9LEPT|nr:beta-propeller fold lactonase family protein [Leptospira levettii]MCW7465768.1 beta-propeller fold lactonase family protein [Leptospira levettii]MCW7510506.1 beta-propeller fold lactonase family protein [Leptospira levettii]MCW7514259.1 beta-propeller fold lactonase family protein [Leptospira levettii]TGM29878.1 IPT/TIG domain protein [Leptospira levettii]TGM68920.1 IPT/TIG domain protein [Leptospira levettii]